MLRRKTMVRPDPLTPKFELPDPPRKSQWADAKDSTPATTARLPLRKTAEFRETRHLRDQAEKTISIAPVSGSIDVREISNPAVRLDYQDANPKKVIHQAVLEKRGDDPRLFDKFFGQGKDWGEDKRIPLWCISLITLLVIGIIASALIHFPKLNRKNSLRTITTIPKLMAEAQTETLDSHAIRKILDQKEQAIAIFATYAKASKVADFLPHLYNSSEMEDILASHWMPIKAPIGWNVPKNAAWTAAGTSARPLGLLHSTLPDYTKFDAYFVYQNGKILLDWKATAGYSTATFEQLKEGRGISTEIRGLMFPLSFYTHQWPEAIYKCYQLLAPDGEISIWCYTKRDERISEEIESLFQSGPLTHQAPSLLKITLGLEPGGEGSLPNQWLIKKMRHIDWIEP